MVKVYEPAGYICKASLEEESKFKLRGTPRVDILCQASLLAVWITGRLDSQVYASELQLLGTDKREQAPGIGKSRRDDARPADAVALRPEDLLHASWSKCHTERKSVCMTRDFCVGLVVVVCVAHTFVSDALRSTQKRMGAHVESQSAFMACCDSSVSVLMLRAHGSRSVGVIPPT